VIILGGDENALSVARALARAGITSYFLNRPTVPARYSRYGRWISVEGGSDTPDDWKRFLLGRNSDNLAGAVLLTCSDDAIELVLDNWTPLSAKFLLEECPVSVRRRLLDKLSTYESAREAGIPVPGFWFARSLTDLQQALEQCRFPVILKPRLSHHSAKIGRKHVRVNDISQLAREYMRLSGLGLSVVIMEFIPGGDDRLCSYYTYMDADGRPLVHFTKRVARRYPINAGRGTYHETTWNPEAAALGERFFRHIGLRGLGNIEFKRDDRDGKLKIIEANARFTAADALVCASGIALAPLIYDRLTGRSPIPPAQYRRGMVLWYPLEDFFAFLELRRNGMCCWSDWLSSVCRTDVFPYWDMRDPLPSLVNLAQRSRSLRRLWERRGGRRLSTEAGGAYDVDRGALSGSDGTRAR
jgi:D-aspartate ligase